MFLGHPKDMTVVDVTQAASGATGEEEKDPATFVLMREVWLSKEIKRSEEAEWEKRSPPG